MSESRRQLLPSSIGSGTFASMSLSRVRMFMSTVKSSLVTLKIVSQLVCVPKRSWSNMIYLFHPFASIVDSLDNLSFTFKFDVSSLFKLVMQHMELQLMFCWCGSFEVCTLYASLIKFCANTLHWAFLSFQGVAFNFDVFKVLELVRPWKELRVLLGCYLSIKVCTLQASPIKPYANVLHWASSNKMAQVYVAWVKLVMLDS